MSTIGAVENAATDRLSIGAMCIVMAALMAAAVLLQLARDRRYTVPGSDIESLLYVRSPETMKRLTLAYSALAADIDWIRAVQYYGRGRQSKDEEPFRELYPLLDRATTLDPLFNIAYRFGAIFLAEPDPGGAGRPDLAIELLEKGLATRPDKWQYQQDIGLVQYWQLHDYRAAASSFERAAAMPGAPWWLRPVAAAMLARGGERSSSRLLWRQLAETGENEWLQQQAVTRLAQLDAMDQIDELEAAISRYQSQWHRFPASWDVLVTAGVLRAAPPLDPSGEPYQLDPGSGRVTLARTSRLYPLPLEPPALSPSAQ